MPLTDQYGQGVPFPTLTDRPNAQTLGQGIVENVVPKTVMTFASAVVRGATIASPKAGMVTWLSDVKRLEVFDGTAWQLVVSSTLPWANISLATGYSPWAGNSVAPRVRREGSVVYLEGRMMLTDTNNIPVSDSRLLGTVPVAYQPVGHYAEGIVALSNAGTGAPTGRIEIWPAGSANPGKIFYYSDKPSAWIGFTSWWFVN